jgi:3-oxosteroid 1-dehydrogenase
MAKNFGFVVLTNELRSVQYFNRAPRAFAVALRVFARTWAARIRRREMLTNGASLIAQMLKALIGLADGEPPLWTNAAMEDLIVEDGRVVGVRVKRDGSTLSIEARRGVLLRPVASATTPTCAAATAGINPTRANGRSRMRATPVRCCKRR